MPDSFGSWLVAARTAVGLKTQSELREALAREGVEISKQAISLWESGGAKPSAAHQARLWIVLGVGEATARQVGMALDGWATFPSPTDPEVAA